MSDVPGYFIGRPVNQAAEPKEEERQGADEQKPTANAQIPGDYFVGRPARQDEANPKPAQEKPNFLAKCCPCLAGGRAEG